MDAYTDSLLMLHIDEGLPLYVLHMHAHWVRCADGWAKRSKCLWISIY